MAFIERSAETRGSVLTGADRAVAALAADTARQGRTQRCGQHSIVFYEGDPAARVYELVSGTVMLYKLLPDGRRQVVEVLTPGMIFGAASGVNYDCSAETLTPAAILVHERHEIDDSRDLQGHLARCLMAQMERMHEHAVLLGRKSALERVTSFLMHMVPGRGGEGCTGPTTPDCDTHDVPLAMTRQEIADYLGLTIETVSRVISELKRRGLVKVERQDRIYVTRVCGICQLTGIH